MLGDVNYYKMLQSAGKPLVGRTGVDRRAVLHLEIFNLWTQEALMNVL
jgi:hypothetical protein